jgi:hypothetical protein
MQMPLAYCSSTIDGCMGDGPAATKYSFLFLICDAFWWLFPSVRHGAWAW